MLIVSACAAFHAAFGVWYFVVWPFRHSPSLPGGAFLVGFMNSSCASARDRFSMEFARLCAAGNLAFVQLTTITGIFGLSLLVAAYKRSARLGSDSSRA